MKRQLGSDRDVATLDLLGCPHVEHLERFPAVQTFGELLRRYLW